jgi:hypothetical protein
VTDGWNLNKIPADSQFAIAELESQGDLDGILSHPTPTVPHAVITNFTPLSNPQGEPLPDKAAPLIEAGWFCQTECYLGDNPSGTPDTQDHFAKQLGWGATQPVFGLYNAPPAAYAQWYDWPGCDYLAENILK